MLIRKNENLGSRCSTHLVAPIPQTPCRLPSAAYNNMEYYPESQAKYYRRCESIAILDSEWLIQIMLALEYDLHVKSKGGFDIRSVWDGYSVPRKLQYFRTYGSMHACMQASAF